MAALTWRSVEAPSFYTSLEGTRLAAGLLDRAVSGVQSGLTGFDRAQDENVANQLALSASRIQDPNQLRSAMSDGTLTAGLDTSRISPAALAALQQRVGTLQTQNEAAYNFDRTQSSNAASDAAAPILAQVLAASRSRDPAAATKLLNDNQAVLGQLNLNQLRDVSQAVQNQENNFLRDSDSRFRLGRDETAYAEQRQAAEAFTRFNPAIGSNADIPFLLQSKEFQALPATVQQGVIGMLEQRWGPVYGPNANGGAGSMTGTAGGAPAGAAASAISGAVGGLTVPSGSSAATPGLLVNKGGAAPGAVGFGTDKGSIYDVTYQNKATPAPITSMNLGDLVTHQAGMIKTQGNSPVGAYQINKGTLEDFGPKVLGKDWQSQKFTPEVQDKIGEAIFKSTNGDAKALKGRWDGLTPAQAEQVAKLPWDQAKLVIAQAESGAVAAPRSMAQVNTSVNDTLSSLAQLNSQNNTSGVANVRAAANDLRSDEDVAEGLVKKFPGVGKAMLLNEISRIKRTSPGVTAAQAAAALENGGLNASEGAGFLGFRAARDWMTGENRWGDFRPNAGAIDDLLSKAVGPEADRNVGSNFQVQQAHATLTAYSQQANAAYNEVIRVQQAAVANPALREVALPAAMARYEAAKARVEATQQAIANSPELQRPKTKAEQDAAKEALAARARLASQPGKASPNDGPPALVPVATRAATAIGNVVNQGEPLGAASADVWRQLTTDPRRFLAGQN